jgi:hypothetical protein
VSKRLRGSMSVYKETKKNKDFVTFEMLFLSIAVGYGFQSWGVWLVALFILFGSLGTKLGLIIGWIFTIIWTLIVGFIVYVGWQSIEITIVFSVLACGISWYVHDCGNLYWRDFSEAEWW